METSLGDSLVKKPIHDSPMKKEDLPVSDEEPQVTPSGIQNHSFSGDKSQTFSTCRQRVELSVAEAGNIVPLCSQTEAFQSSGSGQELFSDWQEAESIKSSGGQGQDARSGKSDGLVSSDRQTSSLQEESGLGLLGASQSEDYQNDRTERGSPSIIVKTLFRYEITDKGMHYIGLRDDSSRESSNYTEPSSEQQQDIHDKESDIQEVQSYERMLPISQQDMFPSQEMDKTKLYNKETHNGVPLYSQREIFYDAALGNIKSPLSTRGISQNWDSENTCYGQAGGNFTSQESEYIQPSGWPKQEAHCDKPESMESSCSPAAISNSKEWDGLFSTGSQTEYSSNEESIINVSSCSQTQGVRSHLFSSLSESAAGVREDTLFCSPKSGSGSRRKYAASEADSNQLDEASEEGTLTCNDSDGHVVTPEIYDLPSSSWGSSLCSGLFGTGSSGSWGSSKVLSPCSPPTPDVLTMEPCNPAVKVSGTHDSSNEGLEDEPSQGSPAV